MDFWLDAALRIVRRHGYTVFPPLERPHKATLWTPTGKHERTPARLVVHTTAHHVTYRHGDDGTESTITLESWHRWRGRVNAKTLG